MTVFDEFKTASSVWQKLHC